MDTDQAGGRAAPDHREQKPLKTLLVAKAAIEGLAGLFLMLFPSRALYLLIGRPLDGPSGNALGRIVAGSLLALGIACWAARHESKSRGAVGLVVGPVIYDATVMTSLLYMDLVVRIYGLLLWAAVSLHSVLAACSIFSLRSGLQAPAPE
ncbi:MAG: hypothetical protein WA639_17665 [Candidatus Acidiferrum sp.]